MLYIVQTLNTYHTPLHKQIMQHYTIMAAHSVFVTIPLGRPPVGRLEITWDINELTIHYHLPLSIFMIGFSYRRPY